MEPLQEAAWFVDLFLESLKKNILVEFFLSLPLGKSSVTVQEDRSIHIYQGLLRAQHMQEEVEDYIRGSNSMVC